MVVQTRKSSHESQRIHTQFFEFSNSGLGALTYANLKIFRKTRFFPTVVNFERRYSLNIGFCTSRSLLYICLPLAPGRPHHLQSRPRNRHILILICHMSSKKTDNMPYANSVSDQYAICERHHIRKISKSPTGRLSLASLLPSDQ
jgi:hypothetical protein